MPYAVVDGSGHVTTILASGKVARRIAKAYHGKSHRITVREAQALFHGGWSKATNSVHFSEYPIAPARLQRMKA